MSFQDQVKSDMAAFITTDEFAETISYTAYGEDVVSVSAVVIRGDNSKESGTEIDLAKSATLYILASDLLNTPNPDGDIATFDTDSDDEPIKWEVKSFNPVGLGAGYKISVVNKNLIGVEV